MFRIYVGENLIYPVESVTEDYTIIEPKLAFELNKADTLEFTLPPTHPAWNGLPEIVTYITVYRDSDIIFYGRVMDSERVFDNCIKYHCEGGLGFLNDTFYGRYVNVTEYPEDRLIDILEKHTAKVDTARQVVFGTSSFGGARQYTNQPEQLMSMEALEYQIDTFGGSVITEYHYDSITDAIRTHVYWHTDEDAYTGGQPITFGRNILDLTAKVNRGDIYTYCYAMGRKSSGSRITVSGYSGSRDITKDGVVTEHYYTSGSFVIAQNSLAEYGRIERVVPYDKANTKAKLFNSAVEAMEKLYKTEFEISALDLLDSGEYRHIRVGYKYPVYSDAHNIDETLICTRAEIDMERPDKSKYTFGGTPRTLSDQIAKANEGIHVLQIKDDEE